MCRSNSDGGRRCPGCGGFKAAAKANGSRRLGRLARKKVVDYLAEQGLTESAKAILAAPPSLLPEFMEALRIDPAILGDTPMPSAHANPPSAGLLVAQALAERDALTAPAAPQISPEQAAVEAAEQALRKRRRRRLMRPERRLPVSRPTGASCRKRLSTRSRMRGICRSASPRRFRTSSRPRPTMRAPSWPSPMPPMTWSLRATSSR